MNGREKAQELNHGDAEARRDGREEVQQTGGGGMVCKRMEADELTEAGREVALRIYRQWRDKIEAEQKPLLEALLMLFLQQREVDGRCDRMWSAVSYSYFSNRIDAVLESIVAPPAAGGASGDECGNSQSQIADRKSEIPMVGSASGEDFQ